jgi:hypothetical protein
MALRALGKPSWRHKDKVLDHLRVAQRIVAGILLERPVCAGPWEAAAPEPFDGVLGFSQGSNLATLLTADLLLRRPA